MHVPYSLLSLKPSARRVIPAWNDPRRKLYPYHDEFWPAEVPEHVYHEQKARRLQRLKRREWVLSFLRFHWFTACLSFARKPRFPDQIIENPMK